MPSTWSGWVRGRRSGSRSVAAWTARRSVGAARRLLAGAVALALLTGCGSGPTPGPDLEAEGRVVLPTGSPLSLGDLTAHGPFGSVTIAADGSFATPMAHSGVGLVLITAPAGDLVLMGFLDTASHDGEVSGASTAAALLYLALGGPFMPGDTAHVLDLVVSDPSMPALAAVVTSTLATEPLALARGRVRPRAGIDLLVLPRLLEPIPLPVRSPRGDLSAGTRTRRAVAGHPEGGVRQYQSGDALRQVHWKQSARQGELLVNLPEAERLCDQVGVIRQGKLLAGSLCLVTGICYLFL